MGKYNPGAECAYPTGRAGDPGLTKRELFAAMALQGMLGRDGCHPAQSDRDSEEIWVSSTVRSSVDLADALVAELAKEPRHDR